MLNITIITHLLESIPSLISKNIKIACFFKGKKEQIQDSEENISTEFSAKEKF